jgi:hypothetical protein
VLVSVVAPARAQAPAGDAAVVQAREAFRLGAALANQEQWVEALASFERSASLRAHPVTTYNIGYAERALGHATRARRMLRRALAESAPGSELPPALANAARGYLTELERRLAHVQLTVGDPAGKISVDGRPLEIEQSSRAVAGTRDPGPPEAPASRTVDVLADPGVHVFVLAASGSADIVVNETLAPGSSTALELGTVNQQRRVEAEADRAGRRERWAWGGVSFGIGAAGLVMGGLLGGAALHQRAILDHACPQPGACPVQFQGNIDSMNRYAIGSTVAFVLGVAGVGTGVTLLLVRPARGPAATGAAVRPWIGTGAAGLAADF